MQSVAIETVAQGNVGQFPSSVVETTLEQSLTAEVGPHAGQVVGSTAVTAVAEPTVDCEMTDAGEVPLANTDLEQVVEVPS